MKPGSIEDTVARLMLWCRRAPKGLARVEFESELARLRVVNALERALAETAIPFYQIDLPSETSPSHLVRRLVEQLASLKAGVVSIAGFTTAFPSNGSVADSLRVLNFNRENLARPPLRQIWWMPPYFAGEFIRAVPDLDSWFMVRLHLTEVVKSTSDTETTIIEQDRMMTSLEDARKRAEGLASRLVKALEAGAPVREVLQSLIIPAVSTLVEAGAERAARELGLILIRRASDYLQLKMSGATNAEQRLEIGKQLEELEKETEQAGKGILIRPTQEPPPAKGLWNVPLPNNPYFVGREQILENLHVALQSYNMAALGGREGIGKTETAAHYSYLHRDEYQAVLWAQANSSETLFSGFLAIARLLELPEGSVQDADVPVNAAIRWLETHEGWLLVLDDVLDGRTVEGFIPSAGRGHVIITTRTQRMQPAASQIEIATMPVDEGALFLMRRSKMIERDAHLQTTAESNRKLAVEISKELGGLPLALNQAGAFIEETGCGLAEYLDLYRRQGAELVKRYRVSGLGDTSVVNSLALCLEVVRKSNTAAGEILLLCALLAPDAIPEEILTGGAPALGPALQEVASDGDRLNATLDKILKYSLLRRDLSLRVLSMHRLVQVAIKDTMDEVTRRLWVERTVKAVNLAFSVIDPLNWPQCERFVPQAAALLALTEQWGVAFPEAARLFNRAGTYAFQRTRYGEAELFFRHAISVWERVSGQQHADAASVLNNLASVYREQGRYLEAEASYKRALEIRQKVFGADHPDVATVLNNLANVYKDQGRLNEAQTLYQRALAIREKALGPYDPRVAQIVSNLAGVYRNQGRLGEAELFYERALAIRQQALGPEHPDVATALNNLANVYRDQGRLNEAQTLYQRALAMREKALGPDDLRVAQIASNLAVVYREQGRYDEAETLYKRALAIRQKVLGPEHAQVASLLSSYATLLERIGRKSEADAMESRAQVIRTRPQQG